MVRKDEKDNPDREAAAIRPTEPEEDAGAGAGLDAEEAPETLQEAEKEVLELEVERLTGELEDLKDRYLRLAAEFDNFRKRTEKERALDADRAQAELVKGLLEALDDLARVSEFDASGVDPEAVIEGVTMVERKLMRALEQAGLEVIEAANRRFDPELHEALTTTPTDVPEEDGIVSQELSRGYLFKGTLLRPALVEVKRYEPPASSADEGPDEGADES